MSKPVRGECVLEIDRTHRIGKTRNQLGESRDQEQQAEKPAQPVDEERRTGVRVEAAPGDGRGKEEQQHEPGRP